MPQTVRQDSCHFVISLIFLTVIGPDGGEHGRPVAPGRQHAARLPEETAGKLRRATARACHRVSCGMSSRGCRAVKAGSLRTARPLPPSVHNVG